MQHSRYDARILGALTATTALLLGLASPSYGPVHATPLARVSVPEAPAVDHHWPTHIDETPHAAAPATRPNAAATEATAATPNAAPATNTDEGEVLLGMISGEWDGEMDWGGYWFDDSAWELAYFHRRNEFRRRWEERREQLRRARQYDLLASGDASGAGDALERRVDVCAVFSRACGRSGTATAATAADHPSTVQRRAGAWVLSNDLATVEVNPERLCAITVTTSALPSNPAVNFSTPTPATGCVVSPGGTAEGASITLDYAGNGWSQRVVLSLADGADAPEATVSVVRARGGGHTTTFLANLSGDAQTWTVQGRAVQLAPGDLGRVRL